MYVIIFTNSKDHDGMNIGLVIRHNIFYFMKKGK